MTFLVEQLGQSDQRPLGGSVKCRGGKFGIGAGGLRDGVRVGDRGPATVTYKPNRLL